MDEKNDARELPPQDSRGNPQEVDLSALSSLSLEPSWASGDKTEKISVGRFSHDDRRDDRRGERRERFGNAPRDRRSPRDRSSGEGFGRERRRDGSAAPSAAESSAPRSRGERQPRRDRGDFAHGGKGGHFRSVPRVHGGAPAPRLIEVAFSPEEKPFSVLVKAIKSSARTYALFEIASLILEKPERFTVTVKRFVRDAAKKPVVPAKPVAPAAPGSAETAVPAATLAAPETVLAALDVPAKRESQLFVAVPDGMPFLNETDALAYVFDRHADKFFDIETVEIEPPKGNFTMVAKCGFTGELLAPPNYHAYQQILRDWHAANFPRMPFEKFMSRLETVKDPEAVSAWLTKMKTVTRYTVKDRVEGEPETLDGAGAAKAFLLSNRKDKVVRAVVSARFPGKLLAQMPMGPMKAGIENELAFQRRFPLDTANLLRGRLRRAGFSLFKRGSKGVTLVCAVRRKFRTPDSVFSDTIQRVFDFLEKHPKTKISDLPKLMLGIGDESAETKPAETKAEGKPAETTAETATTPESAATPKTTVPAETASATTESAATPEAAPAPAEAPVSAAQRKAEIEAQIASLLGTVRWLVLEGYVSELSDGELVTYPKMTAPQPKPAAKKSVVSEKKSAEKPAEEAEDDIAASIPPAPESVPAPETIAPEGAPAESAPAPEASTDNAPAPETPAESAESVAPAETPAAAEAVTDDAAPETVPTPETPVEPAESVAPAPETAAAATPAAAPENPSETPAA